MTVEAPHRSAHGIELPDDVLLSVQDASRAKPKPPGQPPRWLARILPGVKWSAAAGRQDTEEDIEEEEDDLESEPIAFLSPLKELSFDLRGGESIGIVSADPGSRRTLLWMLAGFFPPSSGRIVSRGLIAPVFGSNAINITRETGKKSVDLLARFFHFPRDVIKSNWDEIVDFARVHEIEEVHEWPKGSVEYDAHLTKRLLLATMLHMDASVYLVYGDPYGSDPAFTERCHEVLEQRLKEGCALVHGDSDFAVVGRHCHEAIWLERGEALFRGRLGEVAKFAAGRPSERRAGALTLPLRALIPGGDDVHIGPDGGVIEIELDVFATGIELAPALQLRDEAGRGLTLEDPVPILSPQPGVHTLRIELPGGLLHDGTYSASLVSLPADDESGEETEPHTLLSFEILSRSGGTRTPSAESDAKLSQVQWTLE